MGGLSNIIRNLILINIVAWIVSIFVPSLITLFGVYNFSDPNFAIWQPLTSMFLHGGFLHILFNMIVLWQFGSQLETTLGTKKFLQLYFISGIVSALFWVVAGTGVAVGASGALCGLLAAYLITSPETKVLLFFVIPMKIKYFIYAFAGFSFIMTIISFINPSMSDGVGHIVHLGGLICGYLIALYWKNKNAIEIYN